MDARYQRIAADLRRRIAAGEWPSGDQIPSWRSLEKHYGVGQGAVRWAVKQLRGEGLVEGGPRVRLYVAYPPAVRTLTNPDGDWPFGQGDGEAGTCQATPDLRQRLQVPMRAKLYWERTEFLDPGGRPAMLVTTWRRGALARTHLSYRCEVRPHTLTADEARMLGLLQGMSALLVERTRYDADGRPVQTADLVLPADRWRVGW